MSQRAQPPNIFSGNFFFKDCRSSLDTNVVAPFLQRKERQHFRPFNRRRGSISVTSTEREYFRSLSDWVPTAEKNGGACHFGGEITRTISDVLKRFQSPGPI